MVLPFMNLKFSYTSYVEKKNLLYKTLLASSYVSRKKCFLLMTDCELNFD